jgi:hypothetical protein
MLVTMNSHETIRNEKTRPSSRTCERINGECEVARYQAVMITNSPLFEKEAVGGVDVE